jgi:hypothetical protein
LVYKSSAEAGWDGMTACVPGCAFSPPRDGNRDVSTGPADQKAWPMDAICGAGTQSVPGGAIHHHHTLRFSQQLLALANRRSISGNSCGSTAQRSPEARSHAITD